MQREITLPPTHNKRAPAQWDIISQHVDFKGKTVLDLGCGYADLLWRCWAAGADFILGVDSDRGIWTRNHRWRDQLEADGHSVQTLFWDIDISDFVSVISSESNPYDVVLCFSVLPYLSDIPTALKWIHTHSHTALIECQLHGDGPGPEWLKTSGDLAALLRDAGWLHIQLLGSTYIPDRDKHRTIWMCED